MKTKALLSLVVLLAFVACQKAAQIIPNVKPGTSTKPTSPMLIDSAKTGFS